MPIRILIADDNEVFRKALRQLLESSGHWEIIDACNGQEAISKTLELRPNLVILDLAMPVTDGLSSARQISQVLPDIPILMCTMHMAPHLEAEAHKAGIHEIFSKSESSLLVPAIRQLLAPDETSSLVVESVAPPAPTIPSTASPLPEAAPSISSNDPAAPPAPLPKNAA